MVFLFRHLKTVTFCNIGTAKDTNAAVQRVQNLFFSVQKTQNEPYYVSETVPFATNVNFGAVSMPDICGLPSSMCLKLWGICQDIETVALLFDIHIDLRRLVCARKASQIIDESQLAPNSIILGFGDTFFVLKEDIRDLSLLNDCLSYAQYTKGKADVARTSYSYDVIRRFNSLANGINDFNHSKITLSTQIDRIQQEKKDQPFTERLTSLKFHLHYLHKFVAKQNVANDELLASVLTKERQVESLISTLEEEAPSHIEILKEKVDIIQSEVEPIYESLEFSVYPGLISSLRSTFTVVREVFPIELLESGNAYSIAGIEFPANIQDILDSCYDPQDRTIGNVTESSIDRVNAGLSIISHLILQISSIIDLNLKYTIVQNNSTFYLLEYCSLYLKSLKTAPGEFDLVVAKYPLFYNPLESEKVAKLAGPVKSYELKNQKFERALLLMRKNLVAMNSDIMELYSQYLYGKMNGTKLTNNVPVDCIDNFVWTLNYMLLFLTAPLPTH